MPASVSATSASSLRLSGRGRLAWFTVSPRLRGKCGCGDDYGQYGEQKPNITAGIPGQDYGLRDVW